jgi:hypothetical protein
MQSEGSGNAFQAICRPKGLQDCTFGDNVTEAARVKRRLKAGLHVFIYP